MKFLLSITMLAASVFTTANAAPVEQAQVHNLLTLYESFYSRVYEGNYTPTEYIAGNKTYMIQNMEYAHAIELIQAIKNGAFDECCWKPYAKGYGQYWNATTDTIIANPAMTLMNNENAPYNVPTDYSLLMAYLKQDVLGTPLIKKPSKTWEAAWTHDLMMVWQDNTSGTRLFDELLWSFSYVDAAHKDLPDKFRNHYVYACIVCDGAGFYDFSGLWVPGEEGKTPGPYYEAAVNKNNFKKSWAWMAEMAIIQNNEFPRPQTSIGVTLQPQVTFIPDNTNTASMYPGHCHRATELYVNIDMMQEAQEQGLTAPGKPWSNHFKANVHSKVDYGQYWSHEGNKIAWQAAMYENYKNGFYEPMKNGQFGYNNNGALHSFWPGERWMLAAWSRLTWPQESTYFPYNNVPPDPPKVVTCDAKGQPPLAVRTTVN